MRVVEARSTEMKVKTVIAWTDFDELDIGLRSVVWLDYEPCIGVLLRVWWWS